MEHGKKKLSNHKNRTVKIDTTFFKKRLAFLLQREYSIFLPAVRNNGGRAARHLSHKKISKKN